MKDNSGFSNIYNRVAVCFRLINILSSVEHILGNVSEVKGY